MPANYDAAVAYVRQVAADDPKAHHNELFALFKLMEQTVGQEFAVSVFGEAIPVTGTMDAATAAVAAGVATRQEVEDWFEGAAHDEGFWDTAQRLVTEVLEYLDLDPDDPDNRAEVEGEVEEALLEASDTASLGDAVMAGLEVAEESLRQFERMGAQNITSMASHEAPQLEAIQTKWRQSLLEEASGGDPDKFRQLDAILDIPTMLGAPTAASEAGWEEATGLPLGAIPFMEGVLVDMTENVLVAGRNLTTFTITEVDGMVAFRILPGFAAVYQEVMAGYDPGLIDDRVAFWEFGTRDLLQCLKMAPQIMGGRTPELGESPSPDYSSQRFWEALVSDKAHLQWFDQEVDVYSLASRGWGADDSEPRTLAEAQREGLGAVPPGYERATFMPVRLYSEQLAGKYPTKRGVRVVLVEESPEGYVLLSPALPTYTPIKAFVAERAPTTTGRRAASVLWR